MYDDTSPTARALLVLELVQNSPGITADRLADTLGVSERAARRYVAILREAGVPIESTRGPYGGYRVGRGVRVPPLMFTTPEALGLVMTVLEAPRGASGGSDPVDSALGKLVRVLPDPVAGPAEAVLRMSARGPDRDAANPDPQTTVDLVQYCAARRRLRLRYRRGPDAGDWTMDVDPWAVVVRHGRWYLLCWSHTSEARRVLRVDRVSGVELLAQTFEVPDDLDPLRTVEEHLAEGWRYQVDVVIDAPLNQVTRWVRRSQGRLEEIDAGHTRLVATTDNPYWYAEQLTQLRAPFRVVGSEELRAATEELGRRLLDATVDPGVGGSTQG